MKSTVHISSTREPERSCPVCHSRLDGSVCLSLVREGPVLMKHGDVTKCGYCGSFLKLTEFGFLLADPKELERISKTLQRVVHEMPTLPEMKQGKKKRPS